MSKVLKAIKSAPNAKTAPAKAKAPAKTKAPKTPKREAGFWGIMKGSRKEAVAISLDAAGREAAMKKAASLGIAEGSAKGWIGFWRREGRWVEAKTPEAKAATKKAATKLMDIAADAGAEVADKQTAEGQQAS